MADAEARNDNFVVKKLDKRLAKALTWLWYTHAHAHSHMHTHTLRRTHVRFMLASEFLDTTTTRTASGI